MASFALFLIAACGHAPAPPARRETAPPAAADVNRVADEYFEAYLQLNPMQATQAGDHRFDDRLGSVLTIAYLADSLALERRALHDLAAVPEGSLDAEARLTYDIFKRGRELAIEGFTYPSELLPVNPFDSLPQRFALWGSGGGPQPFATARDYEHWLARIEDFRRWTQQAIANMREGMRRGYTVPRPLVERMLPQFALLAEDAPDNVFYLPLNAMPPNIPEPVRSDLRRRVAAAVRSTVLPSYRELHDFLKGEYLPVARGGLALADLPLGEAWYAHLVRSSTSTTATPAEVHALGVAQVESMHARLQSFLAETAFPGNLAGYLASLRADGRAFQPGGADLLAAYGELRAKTIEASRMLFVLPGDPTYDVRAVPHGCEAAYPPVFYQPAADAAAPGILYVNTGNPSAAPAYALEANALNEGVPGHHLQWIIQQARAAPPIFRRFASFPGFSAGWGAYAAALGPELGLAADPGARFGSLMAELSHAVALVVDTGLHSQGWTRKQAAEYLEVNLSADPAEAAAAVDRMAALPGEALAAGVGATRIQAIRLRTQQQMGAAFDVRAFHTELLSGGAMPLDILAQRMGRRMETPP